MSVLPEQRETHTVFYYYLCIFKLEKRFKLLVLVSLSYALMWCLFIIKLGEERQKRPGTNHDFVVSPTRGLFGTCFAFLNNHIDMQVSVQVGGSRLSLWFVFRKQHVRGDGKDGEQSYSIIISPLFRYTGLTAAHRQIFFLVPFHIKKKVHYS